MGYDAWKAREPDYTEGQEPPEDLGRYPGMRPMSEAPHDDEIIGILADVDDSDDPRVRICRDYNAFGEAIWFDVDGDGAPDSRPWRTWTDDEFIGWLPVPEGK